MLHSFLIGLNRTQVYLLRTNPDGKRHASWRIWVLIFLLPTLFLGAGLLLAWDTYGFISKAERTTGEVVKVYAWPSSTPGAAKDYSPIMRYRFSDDDITEASTGQSSPNWNYAIGSKHEILFDPSVKSDVRLNNFEQLWALPVTIGGIGLVLLIPSLLGAFLVWRWLNGANGVSGKVRHG